MTIDRIISISALIISVVAVPASGYLSFRYAIKGEKRKEFNQVTDPFRSKLRAQMKLLDQNLYPNFGSSAIDDDEFYCLLDVSNKRDLEDIKSAWWNYQESLKNFGEYNDDGIYVMLNKNDVVSTITKLMTYMVRR